MEQDSSKLSLSLGKFSTGELPIVHLTTELYKKVHKISLNLPKSERLGIMAKIETLILEALGASIEASYLPRQNKLPVLYQLRRHIEITKRLIRLCHDLEVIFSKTYIDLSADLLEISKMANGWIKSLTN